MQLLATPRPAAPSPAKPSSATPLLQAPSSVDPLQTMHIVCNVNGWWTHFPQPHHWRSHCLHHHCRQCSSPMTLSPMDLSSAAESSAISSSATPLFVVPLSATPSSATRFIREPIVSSSTVCNAQSPQRHCLQCPSTMALSLTVPLSAAHHLQSNYWRHTLSVSSTLATPSSATLAACARTLVPLGPWQRDAPLLKEV